MGAAHSLNPAGSLFLKLQDIQLLNWKKKNTNNVRCNFYTLCLQNSTPIS